MRHYDEELKEYFGELDKKSKIKGFLGAADLPRLNLK